MKDLLPVIVKRDKDQVSISIDVETAKMLRAMLGRMSANEVHCLASEAELRGQPFDADRMIDRGQCYDMYVLLDSMIKD